MKSLDRAIIVSDTLKTVTSPSFISWVWVRVRVTVPVPVPVPFPFPFPSPFPAPVPVPDSGFRLLNTPVPYWLIEAAFEPSTTT